MGDGPLFDVEATAARPASALARLADGIGRGAAWLFLVAVAISGYEVLMRYAFGSPSAWAHVTVTALCTVGFAVGGAFAMARGEHIRISVLADRAAPGAQRIMSIVGLLVGVLYLAGLAWGFWIQVEEAVWRFGSDGGWRPELTPGPPNWPLPALMKVVLLASTILFALVVLDRLAAALRRRN
ncbi:MAG TPA: TRAP transporter small permease subunit [Salinarimonas sp.]|nr:TRAP transporter small permease subunit [Salinarimonas sp.]